MPGFTVNDGDGPSNTIETLRSHRWRVTNLGPVNRNDIVYAKEVAMPESKFDILEVLGTYLYYKYAKSLRWDDVVISFYDTRGLMQDLYNWKDLVADNVSGLKSHAPSGGYKQSVTIELLSGSGAAIYEATLENAWPKSISHSKLTMTSSDIKQVNVTLAYDYANIRRLSYVD